MCPNMEVGNTLVELLYLIPCMQSVQMCAESSSATSLLNQETALPFSHDGSTMLLQWSVSSLSTAGVAAIKTTLRRLKTVKKDVKVCKHTTNWFLRVHQSVVRSRLPF